MDILSSHLLPKGIQHDWIAAKCKFQDTGIRTIQLFTMQIHLFILILYHSCCLRVTLPLYIPAKPKTLPKRPSFLTLDFAAPSPDSAGVGLNSAALETFKFWQPWSGAFHPARLFFVTQLKMPDMQHKKIYESDRIHIFLNRSTFYIVIPLIIYTICWQLNFLLTKWVSPTAVLTAALLPHPCCHLTAPLLVYRMWSSETAARETFLMAAIARKKRILRNTTFLCQKHPKTSIWSKIY